MEGDLRIGSWYLEQIPPPEGRRDAARLGAARCRRARDLSGRARGRLRTLDGPRLVRRRDHARREVAAWGDHFGDYRDKGFLADRGRRRAASRRCARSASTSRSTRSAPRWIRLAEAAQRAPAPRRARSAIPGFPCYRTVEETFADDAGAGRRAPDARHGGRRRRLAGTRRTAGGAAGLRHAGAAADQRGGRRARSRSSSSRRRSTPASTPPPSSPLRFAEWLVAGYGVDADATWLLDHHEIHLLLQANPDGRKQRRDRRLLAQERQQQLLRPTPSSRGADLNRNFAFQWGCCGGSSAAAVRRDLPRPAAGLGARDRRRSQAYLRAIFPDQRRPDLVTPAPDDATGVYLDLHSYSPEILSPWGFQEPRPPSPAAQRRPAHAPRARKFGLPLGLRPDGCSASTRSTAPPTTSPTATSASPPTPGRSAPTSSRAALRSRARCCRRRSRCSSTPAKVARTPYLTPAGPGRGRVRRSPRRRSRRATPVALTATLDDTRYLERQRRRAVAGDRRRRGLPRPPPWSGRHAGRDRRRRRHLQRDRRSG